MADTDTGATGAQGADQQAQSQGDTPPAQGAPAEPQAQGAARAEGEQDRVAALEAKLKSLEADNFKLREARREWEQQQQQAKPLAQQLEDMKARLVTEQQLRQEQSLQAAAISEATKLGFRNPDVAVRLLDRDDIEYDDRGRPANVGKLLNAVAEAEPYLVTVGDYGGGTRGAVPGAKNDMNTIIRQAAGR